MILQDQEDYATRNRLIQELLTEHGRTLVTNLIHASVFCLHSYMLCDVANVILELLTWDREVSLYKHLFGFKVFTIVPGEQHKINNENFH